VRTSHSREPCPSLAPACTKASALSPRRRRRQPGDRPVLPVSRAGGRPGGRPACAPLCKWGRPPQGRSSAPRPGARGLRRAARGAEGQRARRPHQPGRRLWRLLRRDAQRLAARQVSLACRGAPRAALPCAQRSHAQHRARAPKHGEQARLYNAPCSGAPLCLQGALAASAPIGAYVSALNRPAFVPSRFWEVGYAAGSGFWVTRPGRRSCEAGSVHARVVMARLLAWTPRLMQCVHPPAPEHAPAPAVLTRTHHRW